MASPFSIFRKNQKTMIAILAILAMFAFVVLPNLGRGLDGPSGPVNPVIIEWDYGPIRRFELSYMIRSRFVLQSFLNEAYQHGFMASQKLPQVVPVIDSRTPVNEQNTVQTLVLAKEAEEMGFVVSDAAINYYLKQLTNNSVGAAELNGIVARRQMDGRPVTMNMIFDVLRTELLARQLLDSYVNAAQGVTPGERWESWKRWNDVATIETVPVTTASFLDEVAAPTEEELVAFFDLYKNRVKQPDFVGAVLLESPLPGFRIPPKVAYNYLKADFDDFVAQVAEDITDDQIVAYYEDNKDRQFIRATLFDEPETDEATDETADDTSATEAEEEAESEPEDAAAEEETNVDSDAASSEDTAETPEETESPDAAETPDETETPDAAPEEEGDDPSTPSPDEGAAKSGRLRLSLASFQQPSEESGEETAESDDTEEAESDETEEAETEEAESEESEEGDAIEDASSEADTESDEDSATDEQDEASDVDSTAPAADDGQAEESSSEDAVADDSSEESTADTTQYTPLDEVEDQIRNTLATQLAAARMESVLESLGPELRKYADALSAWELDQAELVEGAVAAPRPETPDMRAVAQGQGLEFGETELLSIFEFNDTELGSSVGTLDSESLSTKAFSVARTEYRPELTKDFDGNHRFLAWIVETSPLTDVTLEELRDEVETAWKMEKARELARDEAQRLADEATKSGRPLSEIFADNTQRPATKSDPFSWLTIGSTPLSRNIQLRLSEVVGIDGAGPEFMAAVFGLGDGEVGVAVNNPHTVAYVVRLVSHTSTERELQDNFLLTSASEVNQVRQANFQNVATSLVRELVTTHHLHWIGNLNAVPQ